MDRLQKRQQRQHVRQWRRLLWGWVLQSVVLRFRLLPPDRNRYATAEQPGGFTAKTGTPDREAAAIFDFPTHTDAFNPFGTPPPASAAAIVGVLRRAGPALAPRPSPILPPPHLSGATRRTPSPAPAARDFPKSRNPGVKFFLSYRGFASIKAVSRLESRPVGNSGRLSHEGLFKKTQPK